MPADSAPDTETALLWRDDGGPVVDRAAALGHLAAADPVLGALIARVGAFRLEPPEPLTPFHYLQRAIVYQQLSGKAAATIFGRFLALYRPRRPSPDRILATSHDQLRAVGLSRAKALAIADLAAHARRGMIPSRRELPTLDPEVIVERLTRVRGIGRWSVEMLLMFYLGHPDVLPVTDLGIQKGFALTVGQRSLPSVRTLTRRAERWRPYRTVACWYLWRSLELPR